MVQWIEQTATKPRPKAIADPSLRLAEQMRIVEEYDKRTIVEMVSDDFASQFYTRQQYEVEAGREMVPLLYESIYETTVDPNLPRNVTIYTVKENGVIFEKIPEGGEVPLVHLGQGSRSVEMLHYGMGIEYTKDLLIFNEVYNLPVVERAAGKALNALLNNLHFLPIIAYSYGSDNQTDGTSLTPEMNDTLAAMYYKTLETAIASAETDTTNKGRVAPYALLISGANRFTVAKALREVSQEGISQQSGMSGLIESVIVYNGWTGTRLGRDTSYTGVTAGKAYLVSLANRSEDFQSYIKQDLQATIGNPDVSRFVLEQVVWDFYMGVYANPVASTQEITWPTEGYTGA